MYLDMEFFLLQSDVPSDSDVEVQASTRSGTPMTEQS